MKTAAPAPLDGVDTVFADLDGVVYAGPGAIPHAVEALNAAAASGIRIGYITNNASRTAESVADHLRELGLDTAVDDVVTSPQAAIVLLASLVPAGSTILVIGGDGLTSVVEAHGFRVTRSADDQPAAVIQGFAPHLGWTDLAEAAFALQRDENMPWVATNTDWTIPQARGIAPGNGTLVSAVHTAVGRLPVVAGKPERAIFDAAVERFSARSALMIGDRLDTDIVGANRAGIPSALVLTGIDGAKTVIAAPEAERPRYLLEDLRDLARPYPEPVSKKALLGSDTLVTSGAAVVRVSGNRITLDKPGSPVEVLRAACAAVWGTGTPIYALDVDTRLYS